MRISDWSSDVCSSDLQRRRLGLDGRVEMPGVSEQPGGWIEQSDLFILSSRFEGWGLVLGEAMAAGLPVISFDCEWGPAEMIEQETSGILVPNGDVAALAETLAKLCSDGPLRIRLGAKGRKSTRRNSSH